MRTIPLYKIHMPPTAPEAVKSVLESGYLADGERVRHFETLLSEYIGNNNLVTTNSCTSAITLSLFMAGVRHGDEVITTPMTCTATNMPIANLGAIPVWCDIDPCTGMMDSNKIETLISERTKAILHVHWVGDVSRIDEINSIGRKNGIPVVEDAASALGAEYKGKNIGNTKTDYVCFSFQAIKHITTGDGGAIAFGHEGDAQEGKWLKRYGIHQDTFRDKVGEIDPSSDIPVPGYNVYMNNIAAAIGVEQIPYAEELLRVRRENGEYYDKQLGGIPGIQLLKRADIARSAFWVYTLLSEERDALLKHLRDNGIQASKVHIRNDIYSGLGGKTVEPLQGLDEFSAKMISIPCGWWVTREDREHIARTIGGATG